MYIYIYIYIYIYVYIYIKVLLKNGWKHMQNGDVAET